MRSSFSAQVAAWRFICKSAVRFLWGFSSSFERTVVRRSNVPSGTIKKNPRSRLLVLQGFPRFGRPMNRRNHVTNINHYSGREEFSSSLHPQSHRENHCSDPMPRVSVWMIKRLSKAKFWNFTKIYVWGSCYILAVMPPILNLNKNWKKLWFEWQISSTPHFIWNRISAWK